MDTVRRLTSVTTRQWAGCSVTVKHSNEDVKIVVSHGPKAQRRPVNESGDRSINARTKTRGSGGDKAGNHGMVQPNQHSVIQVTSDQRA